MKIKVKQGITVKYIPTYLKANYRYINEKKNEPTIYGWQFDPLGYIAIKEEYDKEQYEKLRTNQLRTA